MNNPLEEEMKLLISQLEQLNAQFNEAFKSNTKFDESKEIFMKIKQANARMKELLSSTSSIELFDKLIGKG